MKKILLIVIFSICLFADIKEYTLNDAIKLALENNKQAKISKIALDIANVQYKQALSANYPAINAMIVGQRLDEDRMFEMKGSIDLPSDTAKSLALVNLLNSVNPLTGALYTLDQAQNTISMYPSAAFDGATLNMDTDVVAYGRDTIKSSISVLYPLFTGGKISSVIEQAKLNKLLNMNKVTRANDDVVYDIKKYFYGYMLTNELYKVANGTLLSMKQISDLTKDFYESGLNLKVKKTDYLSVQVTVTLIESMVAKLEQNRELVKSALVNTMGLPWDSEIEINYSDNDILPKNYALAELIKEAYKSNSDIKNMDIALKISQEQVNEAKSGHYPKVALMGEVSNIYNSYEYGFLGDNQANGWNVGFVVDIPLFDGFRTTNLVKEKQLDKKKMYLLEDMLKEGVALQIKNELTKTSIGFKQIQTLKKSKKISKENKELNLKGYQIGAIEPKDVIQSQYIDAYIKADYLKYVHDYLVSLATMDRLIGKELK